MQGRHHLTPLRPGRPDLHVNPSLDGSFAALAQETARRATSCEELEGALRVRYPAARVRESVVAGLRRWYVYRDGTWSAERLGA